MSSFDVTRIHEFQSPGAAEKFLGPINLYNNKIPKYFEKDMSPVNEQLYFQAFHFIKFKVQQPQSSQQLVNFFNKMYIALRNRIVSANMGLVYDCLNKSVYCAFTDKTEFISAGSLTLIKAVENFSPWRGVKFGTYAYRALIRKYQSTGSYLNSIRYVSEEHDVAYDQQDTVMLNDLLLETMKKSDLTDQEIGIIRMRYYEHLRLEDVSQHYKISRERVRQIQEYALMKMRIHLPAL